MTFRILACAACLLAAGRAHAAPAVGKPAPALRVTQFNSKSFDLSALRGKVVIVNFWATWCGPCRGEMPALDAFYRQYHNRGVEVIAMDTERPRARGDARKVAQAFVFAAAMLCDAKDNGFGEPNGLPDTYIVDTNGVVRAAWLRGRPGVTAKLLADTVLPLLPAVP